MHMPPAGGHGDLMLASLKLCGCCWFLAPTRLLSLMRPQRPDEKRIVRVVKVEA